MKIKIGLIEITDPTLDEMHALIERYGGSLDVGTAVPIEERRSGNGGSSSASHADRVVLERLVTAGSCRGPHSRSG